MPYINIDNNSIWYETKNFKNAKRYFVFLHGLGGSTLQTKSTYTDIQDDLGVLYIDLRGNGKSPCINTKKLSFDLYVEDVKKIVDFLDLKKFIIGGISMGAATSIKFALKYPKMVEKVIQIRIAWLDKPMSNKIIAENKNIADYLTRYDIQKAKQMYLKSKFHNMNIIKYPENEKSNVAAFDYKYAKETKHKYIQMPLDQPMEDLNQLKKIDVPVMILADRFDPPHPYQYGKYYKRYIKNSIFHTIVSKNIDKDLHFKQINKYINRFI